MNGTTSFLTYSPLGTAARTAWVITQSEKTKAEFQDKFFTGQEEHGGDIGHVPTTKLLSEIEHEALDQIAYAKELRRRLGTESIAQEKLKQIRDKLDAGIRDMHSYSVLAVSFIESFIEIRNDINLLIHEQST